MFNDHLIFSNNIYDAVKQLQQVQEGLEKAKRSGNEFKELLRQIDRMETYQEAGMDREAKDILSNIHKLTAGDTPKREFWIKYVQSKRPESSGKSDAQSRLEFVRQ